jgi:hypothetical protein
MAYLQLPNGKYLKIPEGMSPDQAYDAALTKFPNLLDEPQQKKGIGAALGKGTESMLGSLRTGAEAILSPEEAAKKGLQRGQELSEKYAEQVGLDPLKKAYEERGVLGAGGELLRQVPLAIAEQAPNLATMFAGAKLGARAPIPGVYGKAIGAGIGAIAPSLLQQFGTNVERQAAEQKEAGQPIDISRGKALAAAVPQAGLDVAASFIPLGGKVAGKIFGPEVEQLLMRGGTEAAERLAQESFKKTLGKGILVGAAAEIPTEITQQMLERAQAGLSLTSADALKEYGEVAYQAGLLAPIGGAGRFIDKSGARGEIAAREKAEEDRIAQESAQQEQEALLNKQAMDEMAAIADESKKPFAYSENQIAQMRTDIGSQRGVLNRELDRLRTEAQKEFDIDKLVDISSRAEQIQGAIEEMSPGFIKRKIQDTSQQLNAAKKELKAAQKDNDEAKVAGLQTEIATISDSIESMKAKLPAYEEMAATAPAKSVKDQIATKLKAIDKARDTGDMLTLAKLAREVKALQSQYGGEQTSLFETDKQGFAYPEAERRETIQAKELEESRPDFDLGKPKPREETLPDGTVVIRDTELQKPKTKEEKLMDDAMAMLREDLPEPEKKAIQQIQTLPIGNLRGYLAKLEADRREVLKNNPDLTKAVSEEAYLKARQEGKKLKPELTPEGKKLATIEDSILATQQRIDEEEIGLKLPKGAVPKSLYELPSGYPSASYTRFAEANKVNSEQSLDELTQTLFNLGKGVQDDIANTPELINKKIEGLRAIVIRTALREVAARRQANGMEMLTSDEALKLSSRIDANLRELINRLPALPKNQVIDAMGMAVEPRVEERGKPSQIKFKKQQKLLEDVRSELLKIDTKINAVLNTAEGKKLQKKLSAAKTEPEVKVLQDTIKALPNMEFLAQAKRKLETRQTLLEQQLSDAVTGASTFPVIVEKMGKITIDPRDLSERPFANLKRALQIIKGDIDEAKNEAITVKGKVQKITPDIKQERDPVAGLNALLPKTAKISKLKSELYQAQNAAKPNADAIKELKNKLIDSASDKRRAALYLEEIEKTKAKETAEAVAKEKAEEPPPSKPGGVDVVGQKQGELFPESLATIRSTPQNFMRFLQSAELYKLREKLGLLEKKDVALSTKMSKAPTLTDLKAQRELVLNLNRLDEVVATYRFNAAQIWQNRRKIAGALEQALEDIDKGTTPKIKELKEKRQSLNRSSDEYKKVTTQINALKALLDEQNRKKASEYAAALAEHDATVEERNATLDVMQERMQDLMVRNVEEERKILARMERQYANQTSPAAKKAKEYADKARAFEATDSAAAAESLKQRVATKRIEEQNRKEALEQLPVIRRITEQTRAFTKADNSKQIRSDIRALEKKLEAAAPGSSQYAKLSVQIGGLKADLDRAIQPLMRKVVQAEIIPEPTVQRKAKKEGVRFARGQTTGYDYLLRDTKDIDKLLEEAQEAAITPEARARLSVPPTKIKEKGTTTYKVAEVKEKEVKIRDELEAAKKELVEHNREVAATEKALKGAKTPKKIAELKKRLAGLRQSSTKQRLGQKIDALTKEYREVRALGTGVERMLTIAESESTKSSRLNPLKTGVKPELTKKFARSEASGKEATRREYAENEAAEAGIPRVDYLNVLDGMERGFKARDEKTQGAGVSQADVNKELAKIKMPKGLDIIVMDRVPPQLAELIQARGYDPKTIRGAVMPDGKVLIVAGNHTDIKDVKSTIAHELIGHVGVDGLLGEAGMRALAKKIQKDENSVFELAKKLGVFDDVFGAYAAARKYMSEEDAVLHAVRELIAHTEEASPNRSFLEKANAFIKAMVGALRSVLRKMGLDLDISTSDIYKLLRDARANFKDMAPGAHVNKMGEIVFRSAPAVANAGFENALNATKGIVAEQANLTDKVKAFFIGFETKYVDRFAPLQTVAKKMTDSLKATQMMYYLRMHDQRMSFVSEITSNGPLDLVKASDGKGFVIRSVKGANLVDMVAALGKARVGNTEATKRVFTLWMLAQRTKTVGLNKLDFSGKVTQELLDEVERNVAADQQTSKAFKEASDIYAKYNEGLINFAVKTGAISKKDADIMLQNKNFIPFYRQRPNSQEVFLEIGGAPAIKIGNLTDQPYLHELIGGKEAILDIFTSALQNTSMLTDMALRNNATKEVANSLASLGMLKSNPDSPKDNGIHKGEGKLGPNTIRFKVDGEMYSAEVDTKTTDIPSELLVKGLQGVNTSLPRVVEILGGTGSFLRKWITRNPAYALRQLIRDPLNAVFVSGLDTVPVASSIKEIANMWRGKNEGEMLLRRSGILGGQVLTGTTEDQNKILNDLLSGKKGWDYYMAQLDKLAVQGDAATRVVMYNNFMKQGLSDMEATLATLESMNFNKRGISPSLFQLSIMVPFMNAQIQGLNVLYKSFRGQMPFAEKLRVKQKLVQRALMMWGFSMIYASLMQDDEAYQNANDDEKYSNWFVPNPFSDEHIKVPIPFEVGLLFKAIPEALVNTIFGDAKAKDAMSAIAKMAWNNVPNIGPAAVKPIVEIATNYSFYTGRDIESARMQQFEPGERYTERTTEIAKSIGGMLNISPTKIEYLIRGYTGSVPLAVASLANPILRDGEGGEKPDSRGMISSETPLIGTFFQPKDASGLINKAYSDMNDVIKVKQTHDKMLEEGRDKEAQAYLDANADMMGMSTMAGQFRQKMGELTKQERAVRSATGISGKEKREALDEIRQAKIELAKEFSSARE